MKTEYEIKFLDIDYCQWIDKLSRVGAIFENKKVQRITIFDSLGCNDREYIRVRDEGDKITLTHKRTYPNCVKSDEIEIIVDSYEHTILFLETIGLKKSRIEEKERITYNLKNSKIDIDTWPDIPTYAEIESNSIEEIRCICDILELNYDESFKGSAHDIFRYYNIEPNENTYMVFSKTSLNKHR